MLKILSDSGKKSHFNKMKNNVVHTTTVKDLNLNKIKSTRAGFIIYTLYNNTLYFMLGVDSRTHELSDFAGGIIYKIDRNPVNTAIRELQEETLEIFDKISIEDIENCPVLYDNENLIIFMPVMINPDLICQEFNEKYQEVVQSKKLKYKPEVCGVTWLTLEEFNYSIKTKGILYSRVQDFLSRAGKFTHLL